MASDGGDDEDDDVLFSRLAEGPRDDVVARRIDPRRRAALNMLRGVFVGSKLCVRKEGEVFGCSQASLMWGMFSARGAAVLSLVDLGTHEPTRHRPALISATDFRHNGFHGFSLELVLSNDCPSAGRGT